jgi:enolase
MAKIVKAIGREILDSRGNPTIEADISQVCRKKDIQAIENVFRGNRTAAVLAKERA